MKKIVEIKFKPEGKAYSFDCGAFVLVPGDYVIVETEQGYGMGCVSCAPVRIAAESIRRPLKKVHRKAIDKDFKQLEENRELEEKGMGFCLEQISDLGLEMNLFSVECTFDGRKLTFFYTADGRVDFRELVKRLVGNFRIKIEMRQVGIRNQAKITGGIGRCGREICCAGFMTKFDPISIRMAKNQGLSLNPTKISGVCGRLMCCLAFEEDTYKKKKKDNRKSKNANPKENDGQRKSSEPPEEREPENIEDAFPPVILNDASPEAPSEAPSEASPKETDAVVEDAPDASPNPAEGQRDDGDTSVASTTAGTDESEEDNT